MNVTIISINSGGIVTLSDETTYRLAPMDLRKVNWMMGTEVTLEQNASNMIWPSRLTEVGSGVSVGAMPITLRP